MPPRERVTRFFGCCLSTPLANIFADCFLPSFLRLRMIFSLLLVSGAVNKYAPFGSRRDRFTVVVLDVYCVGDTVLVLLRFVTSFRS